MTETINRLRQLLVSGSEFVLNFPESKLTQKPQPEKWSKKEIIGHLIDSGINNLRRFTEIQFEDKPYKIRKYNQDGLVKANDYQRAETKELVKFWLAVNNRIISLTKQQTDETLGYRIELNENDSADLRFLMKDYVDHLEHHMNQIMKNI